jgi:hypothetical protein
VDWALHPELEQDVRAALLAAVARELDAEHETESVWWRSGFDDLGGGPAAKEPWSDPGVVEP